MNPALRMLALLGALVLVAAAAYCGEAPDLVQRLNELENQNKELRKELARVAEEKNELGRQVEKLSAELRPLLARVDQLDVEHRNMQKALAQARKDLEARVAETVQQELQGRRTRFVVPAPPPAGFVERPYAGFDTQDLEPAVAKALNLEADAGVLVTEVRDGSPADIAGLRRNDVITRVGEAEIKNFQDLKKALEDKKPNQVVSLSVQRGAERVELRLTLGTRRIPVE